MCNVHHQLKPRFYGIGLGPGDPNLITLKAKKILNKVKTIFVPLSNKNESSFAHLIVKNLLEEPKEIIELPFPMTRNKEKLLKYWKEAAKKIAQKIEEKKEVAFVTLGDPFIYSTYIYLLKTLKTNFPHIKSETIPGISSVNAASARAEIPLIQADEKLAILPGNNNLKELKNILKEFNTIVLMKIGPRLPKIIKLLKELNLTQNSILISRTGTPKEQIIKDLSNLKNKKLGYLSILIIKKDLIE